jgi:hypothetical protein
MSERRVSRVEKRVEFPICTMAELILAVRGDANLSDKHKQEELSACRMLCKWTARETHQVMLDPQNVRLLLDVLRLNPPKDRSLGRCSNVPSLFRRALRRYRIGVCGPRLVSLAPAWSELFARVESHEAHRGCSRFARWCGNNGLAPTDVTKANADAYAKHLEMSSFGARAPRAAYTSLCRAWNRMVKTHPVVWPQVILEAGDRRKVDVLEPNLIDAGFREDLEQMLTCFSSPIRKPKGFRRAYEHSTVNEMRRIYYRLCSIALTKLEPTPRITCVADLFEQTVSEGIIEYYLERFGEKNTKSAAKYAHFLYVAAKYWVRLPKEHQVLSWLHECRGELQSGKQRGMVARNRAMIRKFEDEGRIAALMNQGQDAIEAFRRLPNP